MKRITERDESGIANIKDANGGDVNEILDALAAYEEAEENWYIKRFPRCNSLEVKQTNTNIDILNPEFECVVCFNTFWLEESS